MMKYLEEVEKFCAQNGLDFIGIHYTESSLAPIPEFDFDKEKENPYHFLWIDGYL